MAATRAPLDEVMSAENQNVISGGNPHFQSFEDVEDCSEMEKQGAAKDVTHAGLALMAKDTGRVLTLQRALDEKDPAGGKFEFPGGRVEEGESPIEGAIREWKEETGCPLPPGQVTHDWLSNGMYRGFVYVVPGEDALQINGSPDDRQVLNPDDPDQDHIEVVLWQHPKDLKDNPATRREVKSGTDWSVFGKAQRKAAAVGEYGEEHEPGENEGWTPGQGVRAVSSFPIRKIVVQDNHMRPVLKAHSEGRGSETPDYPVWLKAREDMPGHYEMGDGHHRLAEALARGQTTVKAFLDPQPDDEPLQRPFYDWDKYFGQKKTSAEKPSCECGHPQSEHSRNRGTCDSCWRNFMDHFQDFYQGTGPEVSYCKRYKGDRTKTAMSDRSDYGIGHSPNDDGPPVHNITEEGNYAPEDFYTHMHYYRTGDDQADSESMGAIRKAKWDNISPRSAVDNSRWREQGHDWPDSKEESKEGFAQRLDKRKAGEHMVKVYRAAPKGANTLNTGDWVTLSRSYAKGHSKHPTDKGKDMPVYEANVPAKHVRWPGDSVNEFGYFGPEAKATVRLRGGKDAPRVGPSPKEGSMKLHLASDENRGPPQHRHPARQ